MYFQSLDALLHMDGHGAFVWSAYLITAAVIAVVLVSPGRRRRRLLRQFAGEARRQRAAGAPGGEG
jgi:heme exporter protein D